jgi:cobalamin biosynthesis protein CobT
MQVKAGQMDRCHYIDELLSWHKKQWDAESNSRARQLIMNTIDLLNRARTKTMVDSSYVDDSNLMKQAIRDCKRATGLEPAKGMELASTHSSPASNGSEAEEVEEEEDSPEPESSGANSDDDEHDEEGSNEDSDEAGGDHKGKEEVKETRSKRKQTQEGSVGCELVQENFMRSDRSFTTTTCSCKRLVKDHPHCAFAVSDFGHFDVEDPPTCPGCKAWANVHRRSREVIPAARVRIVIRREVH